MKVLPLVLALSGLSSAVGAQALQDRLSAPQQDLIRQAVLEGTLPPTSVWPQPAPAQDAIVAASDWTLDLDGALRAGDAGFTNETDWTFNQMRPEATWTLRAEQAGHWGAQLHADFYDEAPGWKNTTLVLPRTGNIMPVEARFLTKGSLWYNFDPLQIEFGRDKVHFGALDHSFLISDRIPFLDMVRLRLAAGPIQIDGLVSTLETRTGGGGSDVTQTTLLNVHRIAWRQPTWEFGISETYLVHRGTNGPYVLGDLFPVTVLHQEDFSPNNVAFLFDGQWVFAPGWRFMGQGGFDEINGTIVGLPDDNTDTIWAWQGGLEWQGTAAEAPLTVHFEAGMTHYLWGNFGDLGARALYLYTQFARTETIPLTSPWGPGVAWARLRATWSPAPLTLEPVLEMKDHKEGVSLDLPYTPNHSLEGFGRWVDGRLEVNLAWALGGGWALTLTPAANLEQGALAGEVRLGLTGKGTAQ